MFIQHSIIVLLFNKSNKTFSVIIIFFRGDSTLHFESFLTCSQMVLHPILESYTFLIDTTCVHTVMLCALPFSRFPPIQKALMSDVIYRHYGSCLSLTQVPLFPHQQLKSDNEVNIHSIFLKGFHLWPGLVNIFCLSSTTCLTKMLSHFWHTVKPVFKGHLNIWEKVSLHDRYPFITGVLTWGR